MLILTGELVVADGSVTPCQTESVAEVQPYSCRNYAAAELVSQRECRLPRRRYLQKAHPEDLDVPDSVSDCYTGSSYSSLTYTYE